METVKRRMSYPKKLIRKNQIKEYFVISSILIILIILLLYSFKNINNMNQTSLLIGISMILGVGASLAGLWMFKKFNSFFDKTDNNIRKAKLGANGEKIVIERLHQILDANKYNIIPNFKIPERNFDIDCLIIGPKGVIIVEVKNLSKIFSFHFSERKTLRIKEKGYTREITSLMGNSDPRIKLKNHCKSFNYYLSTKGFYDIKAKKILVFINNNIKIDGKAGVYIISGLNGLDKYFNSLDEDNRFTPKFCKFFNKKLEIDYKNN